MSVCPACNAFKHIQKICPQCQSPFKDSGRMADYLGPYSHYTEFETQSIKSDDPVCIHYLTCDMCGLIEIEAVHLQ